MLVITINSTSPPTCGAGQRLWRVFMRFHQLCSFILSQQVNMAETVTVRRKKWAECAPSKTVKTEAAGCSNTRLKTVENKHRPPFPDDQASETTALAVPFKGHIQGGMRPGKKVMVMGIVDSRPDRFYVGLTCGRGTPTAPPTDVALELCVRFKERQVLRRARVSGTWGDKERDIPFFPFIRDQPFRIDIQCEQSRLRVFVDGEQLFHFDHRVPMLKDIDTLWINGSMRITKLG